ncbi:MAG: hypothetical protein ACLP8S_22810 [Solirubrobacteraceae bacterium]
MSADLVAPYERLARMIERELELVSQRRFEELQEAVQRRGVFLATLAVPCPLVARPMFERARVLHERLVIDTRRAQDSIGESLGRLREVRRAVKGYGGTRRHRYSATA